MDCYIALGSNLGGRRRHLLRGIDELRRFLTGALRLSSVWETEPVGTTAPQWFLNMVLQAATTLPPMELLERTQQVERRLGRVPTERNGPRSLDLDLLLVGDLIVEHPRLRLPHPRMWKRRFVLEPLAEIAPALRNPSNGRTVEEERARLADRSRVWKVGTLYSRENVAL